MAATQAAAPHLPAGGADGATARAYIGLGANLGDSVATLIAVWDRLLATPGVLDGKRSPLYRSAPVDATGPDFINAVGVIDTTLTPLALLDVLQALEQLHGRQRPYPNAPRTLDLDLLLYGTLQLKTDRLVLPHPRMHQRAFVLRPLLDIEPRLQLEQGSVADLLTACDGQVVTQLGC